MKISISIIVICLVLSMIGCTTATKNTAVVAEPTLKEALKDKFYIGAALNLNLIHGKDSASANIVKTQFNSIVPENCMKSMYMQPERGRFFFDDADEYVKFGEDNNLFIIGHTLVWHSQAPGWLFIDSEGKDVSKEVLIERLKTHITTIVSRYKGRVKGWDVVNEAIMDDGSWRRSKLYQIIGEDFIPLAFEFAHAADPDAELYYNDYNEWHPEKRNTIIKLVKSLREKGIRIDAVGLQGHIGMDYPSLDEYQATIDAYSDAGIKVMITELDMSILPSPRQNVGANVADTEDYKKEMNPYTESLPDSVAAAWEKRFAEFFNLFLKNSDKIKRVTMWGVSDKDSWKNDYPMMGRTDYPLLFDRSYKAKPLVKDIIEMANKNSNLSKH